MRCIGGTFGYIPGMCAAPGGTLTPVLPCLALAFEPSHASSEVDGVHWGHIGGTYQAMPLPSSTSSRLVLRIALALAESLAIHSNQS